MTGLSQDLLSKDPSIVWIAALCIVLSLQCKRLGQMHGEHRCHHISHLIMLVGMIYMFSAMAFEQEWIPRGAWMVLYAAISIAILVWMMIRLRRQGSVGKMWIFAFVQQAAMVYMCCTPMRWIPIATYALVLYFACEALASLLAAPGGTSASGEAPTWLLRWPDANRFCMFAMAASMGYMFLGMQLKAISKESERLALQKKIESIVGGSGNDADQDSMLSSLAASSLAAASLAAPSLAAPPPPANEALKPAAQPEQVAGAAGRQAAPQAVNHSHRLRTEPRSRGRAHRLNPRASKRHWLHRR
jgi:hypothetical protein